ncbi:Lachrymatory-factor synthase [Ananas comosus]|uniref:Lachrymatory-factor synthase n=1 Tax=Ananas comosus TaxID=4615 RepID=A0A199W5E5_ANACO|nr:Lachrymatory-factor synthase [Ananas comosus]
MAAASAQEQQARDAESCGARWSGAVSAALPGVPAGRAWALLSDFFAIQRWLPGVASCERAGGGSVRRVADASGEQWALEELLATDAAARSVRYAVLDSSLGLRGYTATLKVAPEAEEEGRGGGCRIEWSFECEPGEGWSREGLAAYLHAGAKAMAERVAAAVRADDAAAAAAAEEEEKAEKVTSK